MENNQNDYQVSFFKPVTPKARRNRNMVVWLISIWAIAVFGFQILLKVVEKPTPEVAYNNFVSVWDNIEAGYGTQVEKITFANSILQVLGKVYIKPEYKAALSNGFSWAVFQITDSLEAESLKIKLVEFENIKEASSSILDPTYLASKASLENEVSTLLGVEATDARRLAIPTSVKSDQIENYTDENKALTAKAMPLYLIHNRSFLTDTKFLGFPFHYFYTAFFLLTLFIGLCWSYCYITDRRESQEPTV